MNTKSTIIGLIITVVILILLFPVSTRAQETLQSKPSVVNIYFFWDKECTHCVNEDAFLKNLTKQNTGLQVHSFEINEAGNGELLAQIAKEYELDLSSVPVTFIGAEYLIGFESEETTGKEITNLVEALKLVGDNNEIGKYIFEGRYNQSLNKPETNILGGDESSRGVPYSVAIDRILKYIKADIILGGILLIIILVFAFKKLTHK